MPNVKLTAPPAATTTARERMGSLGRKPNRTPAENTELLTLLADRVAALEARLAGR